MVLYYRLHVKNVQDPKNANSFQLAVRHPEMKYAEVKYLVVMYRESEVKLTQQKPESKYYHSSR